MPIEKTGSDVTAPADRGPSRRVRTIVGSHAVQWCAAGAVVVVYGVLTGIHTGNSRGWIVFANSGELLAATLAMLACALRSVRERRAEMGSRSEQGSGARAPRIGGHVAWALISAAMGAWAIGQAIVNVYEIGLGVRAPEPSAADVAYLLSYVLLVSGVLAFVRTPAGHLSRARGAVEGLLIAGGVLLCSWSLVIGSVFANRGPLDLGGLVNLSYPVLDAVTLAAVLFVGLKSRRARPAGLELLALGIVFWSISDSAWWYITEVDSNAPSVTAFETGWIAGFLLITIAALRSGRPKPPRASPSVNRFFLTLPGLPAVAGLAAVATGWLIAGQVRSPDVVLAITAVCSLLAITLLIIVTYENHALTSELERRVRRRTAALRRTESYYRALVQHSSDVVMVVDAKLTIRYASDSAHAVFGRTSEELVGRDLSVFGGSAADTLGDALGRVLFEPGELTRVEWSLSDAAGAIRFAESTVANLLHDPDIDGFVLNTRDDTDRVLLAEQLRIQAFHDPLTGLPNRALLSDRAGQAFERAQRSGSSLAIIAVDIDAFKLVNDGFGHRVGDLLLCGVAERLQASVRPQDTVARLGGDEFVVLMDETPDVETALALAGRLHEAMRPDMTIADLRHGVTVSVGVAVGSAPNTNFDQLLCDADVALYEVKATGRNAVRLFRPSTNRNISSRVKLQNELREAIDSGGLCLFYQPEFFLGDGALQGFEALVRWPHGEHGMILPDGFIPLAEETGLIVPLGRWVMEQALRQAASWPVPLSGRGLSVSVNVSAVQLRSPGIVAEVEGALLRSGIAPERVVLEVTESSFIDGTEPMLDTLRSLRALGVRLAIDDFGTGYASVSNLQRMPIDILKIDRSFIASVTEQEHGANLLEAIVSIARALSLVTIAEGVEEPLQLETARRLGCDVAQGYLLGRPMSVADARDVIASHTGGACAQTKTRQAEAGRGLALASTRRARSY